MPSDFLLGCTYNFLQPDDDAPPLRRFEMVRDSGVFDYINWLPPPPLLKACVAASEKTGVPMTTGNCSYQVGGDGIGMADYIRNASTAGIEMLNVMLRSRHVDGHELSDQEIVDAYKAAADMGERTGVAVTFELHVDCWSEKFKRVTPVIERAREQGIKFNFTIDYSHVIFKIENPEQQDISEIRDDVEAGRIALDPFEPGNLCKEWLDLNVVSFAQFRPVVPNNPRNVWAKYPDGSLPRGIMYPFVRPAPGEWHSSWHPYRLEACKEAFRTILRHHLCAPGSPLKYVITEMIGSRDYGLNAGFSLFEHNVACARWIRDTWSQLKAMKEADIPLTT